LFQTYKFLSLQRKANAKSETIIQALNQQRGEFQETSTAQDTPSSASSEALESASTKATPPPPPTVRVSDPLIVPFLKVMEPFFVKQAEGHQRLLDMFDQGR